MDDVKLFSQYHYNRQLFSDYYLNIVLPRRADWQNLANAPKVRELMEYITSIWHAYTPSDNEAQTEHEFIRPILEALGHTFEVQPSLQTPDGTKRPDYILYRDQDVLVANKGKTLTEEVLQHTACAVADAKYWDRPLDNKLTGQTGDPFNNKNPSYQIDFYMRHSGLEWGILTNGRKWRLYHAETSKKLDCFYEVDLQEMLKTVDPRAFLYFYAFFHRSAFDDHPLGVAHIRQASQDSAQGISDSIKDQVYLALRHLAQGILDCEEEKKKLAAQRQEELKNPVHHLIARWRGRSLKEPDNDTYVPPTLKQVYDHALIVLYRLLFILYAEARDLLPLRTNRTYREWYSLYAIAHDVAYNITKEREPLPMTAILWTRLHTLFHFINHGCSRIKVATFNGGLFDPRYYPFLEERCIGDARLQDAIDLLARVNGEFVDYRDLAEQHLGTIYEGLLEYHLRTIDREGYWTIDLFNEKGERKASGSYYTPGYVVDYIVEQTLNPVLQAAIADAPDNEAKIRAILNIKVLDPSMGSGHFLVAATEYIARFLVDLDVSGTNGKGETDLAYWKRRVTQACIYGVDVNPLAVDLAKLSLWLSTVEKDKPLSFLEHHLRCGNTLVGAWLDHLRLAEGVIDTTEQPTEATTEEQAYLPTDATGQFSMVEDEGLRSSLSTAVDLMWLIQKQPSNTLKDVREQERLHAEMLEQLTYVYRILGDITTATYFGVAFTPQHWPDLYAYATMGDMEPLLEPLIQQTRDLVATYHFFHWELQFPELFFDTQGQPLGAHAGFDVVIGNPPYVRAKEIIAFKQFLAENYYNIYHGEADIYVYFYRQGVRLLRQGGRLSYIVTNKWLRSGYGEPLRGYFAANTMVERIVDFGHAPIFPEADVFPCIMVLKKPAHPDIAIPDDQHVYITTFPRNMLDKTTIGDYVQNHSHTIPQKRLSKAPWSLEPTDVHDLVIKIQAQGIPLKDFAGVKPNWGIMTGLNAAFLIDTPTKERLVQEDPRCADIIKPYLRGRDIKRWVPEWAGLWMIVLKSSENHSWPWSGDIKTAEHTFATTYPSLYHHLKPFEDRLRKRYDKGHFWWELRSCAYYDAFEKPKIITQDLATYSRFCFDDTGLYTSNTCYIWSTQDKYILACFCSPLMWWFAHRTLQHAINDTLRMFTEQVEKLPIAQPTDAIRAEVESTVERLIAITKEQREYCDTMLDWLRTEFDIEKPGQKLEDFATLSSDEFVAEVRRRRRKGADKLKPAALKTLREGYDDQAIPLQHLQADMQQLECRISDLVNAAYGLTPAEVDLLWRTAPPRMPMDCRDGDRR